MPKKMNVIELSKALISCPSVTPKDEGALQILTDALEDMGFTVYRLPFGEGEGQIENIFARLGDSGPHICYGGHTDVVPPGPLDQWTFPPFDPTIKDGILYGRGASDMKGSVAAFTAAISAYLDKHGAPKSGSISMLITGDEEADAINGTVKVLEWMKDNDHVPDVALVGEPTNPDHLGQEIKIGRRGSLGGVLTIKGKQGHVAYPQKADNPLPRLARMVDALSSYAFDEGSKFFQPTNLELTTIDVGNTATNVIPGEGVAKFNVRFNDHWNAQSLEIKIREILDAVSTEYALETFSNAESFITQPGQWTEIIGQAVTDITGKSAMFTTTGGTSDARFIVNYCPVVEFGPVNETIHKIDENAEVAVLEDLTKIYERILELYFKVA